MNRTRVVVRVVAVLFVVGGVIRMLANPAIFSLAGIGELWVDAPYFVYVYRVLGAFVVLTGLYLWSLAGDGGPAHRGARSVTWGLGLAALVMLVTGWRTGLPARFYLVDVVFCAGVVLLLVWVQARRPRAQAGGE